MSNTLTGLIPTIYEGLDVVSREMSGLTRAVSLFPGAERVALNATISYPVVPAYATANITPAATGPDPSATVVGAGTMSITKSKGVSFFWEGDEQLSLAGGYNPIFQGQISQALRALVNEMETDLAGLHVNASRAIGTAGTTPFASTLADTSALRKVLSDNGAPLDDLQLAVNTDAGQALRDLTQLQNVNQAGGDDLLRRGVLMDVHGFTIRESNGIANFTKGTAAGATTNAAGYAIGDTVLTLASAGTGTILIGDVVTFAGDTANKYVIASGDADVSGGGTVTLAEPGLRVAMSAATKAITVLGNSARNMAFSRSAIHLATRLPAMPAGGDAADDVVIVTDPVSGISFQIALYRQFARVAFLIGAAWGTKCVKSEHSVILLG